MFQKNQQRSLTAEEALSLGLELNIHEGNKKTRYRINDEQYKKILHDRNQGIIDACNEHKVDPSTPKFLWLKNKNSSIPTQNPLYEAPEVKELKETILEAFDGILNKYTNNVKAKPFKPLKLDEKRAIKVTLTDSHVGMNVNPDNNALFQYEYNAEIYRNSMNKVYWSVIKEFNTYGTFDQLLFDDLGDLADGWNGYTTRGGHDLPQNMTNSEVFEVCVDSKVEIIKRLVDAKVANKIILRSITNDNHAGDFSLIINLAIKKVINLLYNKEVVEVDILTRFIEHRTYGKHCFVLTHGKDKKQMNRGLPIHLNDKAVRLINDYIEHYEIDSKFIHVEKGDLHQIGYEKTKRFDYRNFMSFAPPSSWVQHNFGDSYAGYSIQIIPKNTNEISHTDYFLEYDKRKN
jgi:hypothetical protein